MSYNIDSVEYISGHLDISDFKIVEARRAVSKDDRPEACFLNDEPGGLFAFSLWSGEWSGHTWKAFKLALTFTHGEADLLICWEGGDSFSGLRVSDGVVTEHQVVHSLGEEIS